MVNFNEKITKYSFFAFNAVYMIGCIALLTVAGIIQYTIYYYDFFSNSVAVPSIMLLCTSSTLIVVAALGYFGAIRGTPWMLIAFAIAVGVLSVLQLSGGCLALSQEYALVEELNTTMATKQVLYVQGGNSQESEDAIRSWDFLQEEFYCCGRYTANEWRDLGLSTIPASCSCQYDQYNCTGTIYSDGCYLKLRDYMHVLEVVLGILAISFFAVLLFSIGLAQMMGRSASIDS